VDAGYLGAWLGAVDVLEVVDEASASEARVRAREAGRAAMLADADLEALAIVASELARNQLRHAGGGKLAVRRIESAGVPGVELVAADAGPGIADPTGAFRGSSQNRAPGEGLGIGLAAVRRLADEVDVDVRLGDGTCIWVRKLAARAPRRREVAIFGRRCAGESMSGDDGAFVRSGEALLVAAVDGLGHGPDARRAAALATATIRSEHARALAEIVGACDQATQGTRGCVLGVARIDDAAGRLGFVGVGDVCCRTFAPRHERRAATMAGVVGARGRQARAPRVDELALGRGDVVVLGTDGLRQAMSIAEELSLMRRWPIEIAQHLLTAFGRDNDDALVVVAK
jgi:anti-sigma regulatory factor (Ser/Thr protein kinase)